ncbi:MFS general substrate transporter [Xylona heveae TC161]|uniref:MFS general substrate transporter n=1 Tax=Xylona heveae (strain CBS 132557 / TC161) TaxID=1328760 RepID=A0A165FWK5_XYLHT|nr:MFS general substrate transporter [Xylona heveae TC161]KZF21471.1 MFS general substrate transporter [Xylona heveae TC161]
MTGPTAAPSADPIRTTPPNPIEQSSDETLQGQTATDSPFEKDRSYDPTLDEEGKEEELEADVEKEGAVEPPPPAPPAKDPNVIEWDGPDDPGNPQNWPLFKKWRVTIMLGMMTFCVTFASSVFSTAIVATSIRFHVSTEVMTLGVSLFVLGFALGPLMWGPFSELFGRKKPLFAGYILFVIFQVPVAVAQNVQTIMLCRFFGGLFGSAPLAIVGGALADFWGPVDRGVALCVFAGATFIGPIGGPILGGFITQSYLGWRWTAYITLIIGALMLVLGIFLVPESYGPVLLQQRAKRIRYSTKNWAVRSKLDETELDMKNLVNKYLLIPIKMLIYEPILILVTIYLALIYGIMYLFFESYPISFQEERGWNEGVGALPFLGIGIGVALGCGVIAWTSKTRFARKMKKHGRVIPEERLPPMILGAIIFPPGLFWFAWTSNKHILWVPQVISGIPIGMGVLMIFMQGLNYLIDVYLMHANSAIAANTLLRSAAGAGFPLFAAPMFHNLGVAWATSLLAFLLVAMAPVPIIFFFYGKKIRQWSKYSPTAK